jgi:PKD repeat protein
MNTKKHIFALFIAILLLGGVLPATITFTPANPVPGQMITFTLNPTHPNMEMEPKITWTWADGSTEQKPITQLTATHAYASAGNYEVSARYYYYDIYGAGHFFTETIMVRVSVPIIKTISFSPGNPNTCEPVTFQTSGFVSTRLRWDFGDGTVQDGGGVSMVHAYSNPGSYMVRVFDNNGSDANPASTTVAVSNKRSIALLTAQPKTGIPVSFQASGFISTCLLWDFGDGQPRVKGTAAANHIYANPGSFQVKALDNCGESLCLAGTGITVEASQGPMASFAVSYAILRFENGTTSISVTKDKSGLTAYADLKFEGSGLLQAEWRVDGQPFKITTQSLGFANQVTINSGPIPGLPTTVLGPHTVSLHISKPALFFSIPVISYYVTAALQPVPPMTNALAPIIQTIVPDTLERGKEFVLDLQGMRLTPDTVISLGTGIAVNSFTLINPMRASLDVFVSPTAKTGDRFAKASNPNGSNSGPGKIEVAAAPPQSPVSIIDLACTDLSTLVVEPIELKAPRWRTDSHETIVADQFSDGTAVTIPGEKAELCMPVIDDLVVLRWKSIPVYDFQEVRFFKASNNTLLMTKKISGSSQSLPLSAALINELFSHIPAPTGQVYPQTQYSPGLGAQEKADIVNIPGMTPEELEEFQNKQMYDEAMKKADILWQVVGFRTFPCVYDSKKDAPSQINQSIMVAQSELWMFQLPDRPNGLACPAGSGMHKGSAKINIPNKSLAARNTSMPKNSELTINYVGDEFVANGFFDLARSPYGSTIIANATPAIPNLFIDWGDGTPSSTLDVKIEAGQKDRWDKSVKVSILPSDKTHHVYKKASNQYIIRIFELSENDIQKPAAGFLAKLGKALKPEEPSPSTSDPGMPYRILLEQQGGYHAQAAEGDYESFADKLGRAYMIYCRPVTIEPYRDTCVDQPISLTDIEIIDFPGHSLMIKTDGQKPPGGINLKQGQSEEYAKQLIDAVAVTCDTAFYAKAELTYFGTGFVELTWRVDGQIVETRLLPKLKSEERANLSLEQAMDCSSPKLSREQKDSMPFPVKGPLEDSLLGVHTVTVEARVVSEFSVSNLGYVAVQSVENMWANAGKVFNGEPAGKGPAAQPAADNGSADPLMAAMGQAGHNSQSAPQIGFLNPDNTADGNPAVVYLNDAALAAGEGALDSSNRVFSSAKKYQVNEVRNQLGCLVLVPDNKGEYFHLTDMGGSITLDEADDTYSASGTLHIWCPTGTPGSVKEVFVPFINFSKWSITDETGILTNGILDVSPQGVNDFQFPAFIHKAVLTHLQGGVDGNGARPMMATFDFDLPMNGLKQISSLGGNTFASIKQATGQLAATSGDWFASDLKLGKSQFIYTPFFIQSDKVSIDLSAHENPAAITKANWMGVHLGDADITPYTMGFTASSNNFAMVTKEEWVITSGGLNGKSASGPFQSTIAQGTFGFDSVEFSVTNDVPKGIYHNVKIFAPWLATALTGEAELLQKSNGSDYITELTLVDHPPVILAYSDLGQQGKVTMTASDFSFRSATDFGSAWPAVECRLVFNLECEGVPFAEFASDDFDFLFNGCALFGGKYLSKTFIPGSPSHFGLFASDLTKATVTAFNDNSSNCLDIAVDTKIHYADDGMSSYVPASNTAIHYRIFKSVKDYSLEGPISESNNIKLDFPLASQDFGGTFQPEYTPGASPALSGTPGSSGPSAGDDPPSVSISPTRFSAKIPLEIFGMDTNPKITATFILGNQNGKSYFLTVADIGLPLPGITLSPIPLSIYGFKGGFGYHFDAPTLAFADVNSQPNMNVTAAFSAGVTMGTTADDGFTLKGSATLSGDSSGNFQMDFTNWQLLSMGNFGGQLKYASKVFSGALYGNLKLFDQLKVAEFLLGNNLAQARVKFSFGGGDWYIYAGNKNGDRIEANIWGLTANGYMMLDGTALQAGGGITQVIPPGADKEDLSVYVKSYIDVGFAIYFDPFRLVGDFDQGIGVGGCVPVFGCGEASVTGKIHVEAPDPTIFQVCFSVDWPLDGKDAIDYCVNL